MEYGMTMMTEAVWLEEPTDIGCMEPEDVLSDPSDHALVEPKQELIECIPESQENKEPEYVLSDPSDHALVEPKQELIECIPESQENKEPEYVLSDPSDHALVEPKQELIECIPESQENKNIKVEVDVEDGPEIALLSSNSRLNHEDCNSNEYPTFTYRTDSEKLGDCDSTNGSHKCPVCSKNFGKRAYLNKHVKIHNKNRHQQCEPIQSNSNVSSAMKPIETNPENKCSLINSSKKLQNAANRKNHNLLYAKKRNFYCQEQDCDRGFVLYNHLKEHMERHKLPTFFECEVCKKKFAHRGSLRTHKVVHSGQRDFECNVCLKRFTLLGNLTKHKFIHSGEKRFGCPMCSKRFSQKCSLDRHMTIH